MNHLPYEIEPDDPVAAPLGLIVLQTDETIEADFRRYFADTPNPILVSRIPSGRNVTRDMLQQMQAELPAAAALLPSRMRFAVVGYGCTSASSLIGSEAVETLVQSTCDAAYVTNPLRAAIACCASQGVSRLALLSPYVEEVNEPLRKAFADNGIATEVFGTFSEADDANVARIAPSSIIAAALELGRDPSVDGVFLSCTNLRTYEAIPSIQTELGKPVLSSNQALAWHMRQIVDGA